MGRSVEVRGRTPRARWAVGLVAIGVLLVTACGGGEGAAGPALRVPTVERSTERAGSARFVGTSRLGTQKPLRTTFHGEVDFGTGRSSFVTRAKGGGKPLVSKTRFVDGLTYLSPANAIGAPPEGGWFGESTVAGKDWVRLPYSAGGFGTLGIGDAPATLRTLAHSDGRIERLGPDVVRGATTQHYRFVTPAREPARQVRALAFDRAGAKTIDVWVDSHHRLRRVLQLLDQGRASSMYDVEFFQFGAPVAIATPPADDVVIDDTYRLTLDWQEVQHGRVGGDAWQLLRAPTSGGECFSHVTVPRSVRDGDQSMQRGRTTERCAPMLHGPANAVAPTPDFVPWAVALPNGHVLFYGAVSPAVRSLTLHFVGGRTESVRVEDRTFAVTMAADELVDRIQLHGDRATVGCPLVRSAQEYGCPHGLATSEASPQD